MLDLCIYRGQTAKLKK